MNIPGIATEDVTNETLAAEAVDTPAPEPTKRTRTKKAVDPEAAAKKAEEKAAKEAARALKKAEKTNKEPRSTMKDKFIKVLVPAAESGLREGTGRFQFLQAAESATKVGDLIGQEFTVGDKTVKLTGANIQGMFSRGHVALSDDGENWTKIQIERVAA